MPYVPSAARVHDLLHGSRLAPSLLSKLLSNRSSPSRRASATYAQFERSKSMNEQQFVKRVIRMLEQMDKNNANFEPYHFCPARKRIKQTNLNGKAIYTYNGELIKVAQGKLVYCNIQEHGYYKVNPRFCSRCRTLFANPKHLRMWTLAECECPCSSWQHYGGAPALHEHVAKVVKRVLGTGANPLLLLRKPCPNHQNVV